MGLDATIRIKIPKNHLYFICKLSIDSMLTYHGKTAGVEWKSFSRLYSIDGSKGMLKVSSGILPVKHRKNETISSICDLVRSLPS